MKEEDLTYSIISTALLISSFVLFRVLSISTEAAFSFASHLPTIFIEANLNQSFITSVVSVFSQFLTFIVSFVPVGLAFGIMILYGMKHGSEKKVGLIPPAFATVFGLFVCGFTFPVLFFGLGLLAGGFLSTNLGEAYPEELEKWNHFRTGSKAGAKMFLVLVLFLTIGVFLQVGTNMETYKNDYIDATEKMTSTIIDPKAINMSSMSDEELVQQLPRSYQENLEQLPEEERQEVLADLRNRTGSQTKNTMVETRKMMVDEMLKSEGVSSFLDFYILITVLMVPGVLLFFRTVLFAPLAGLVTLLGSRD